MVKLIFFAYSELNLAVASHISDRITDQVIESLSTSYKSLIGECEIRTRSSTPDVLRPSAGSTSSGGGGISGGGSVLGVVTGGLSAGTPVVERTSLVMDEEEDRGSSGRGGTPADGEDRVLLGKAMGRLSAEDDSPLVSFVLVY